MKQKNWRLWIEYETDHYDPDWGYDTTELEIFSDDLNYLEQKLFCMKLQLSNKIICHWIEPKCCDIWQTDNCDCFPPTGNLLYFKPQEGIDNPYMIKEKTK